MQRTDKINYYLDIAQTVSQRGTCLRRKFGAIIVKDDVIVSTGYAGAPRGRQNCCDMGTCLREKMNIPRGERYELCRSVHAEANAIISASRDKMLDATLYLTGVEVADGSYAAPEPDKYMKITLRERSGGMMYVSSIQAVDGQEVIGTTQRREEPIIETEPVIVPAASAAVLPPAWGRPGTRRGGG